MSTSPVLGLTLMSASQAQKETVFNEFLIAMDALFKGSVLSAALSAPPGSPAEGDAYIVGVTATGAWNGWDNQIVFYFNGWQLIVPPMKIMLYDVATSQFLQFQGGTLTGGSFLWDVIPASAVVVLNDLSNVSGTPTNGQVLTWSSSAMKWQPATPSFTSPLSALSDVNVTEGNGIDGFALVYNQAEAKWIAQALPTGTLLGLSDVVSTGAGAGWVLVYNPSGPGAHFVNPSLLSSVASLANIGDVTYGAGLTVGDIMQWNGTQWSPAVIGSLSLMGLSDTDIAVEDVTINGCALVYNSTVHKWVPDLLTSGSTALSSLSDVNVTEGSGIDGYAFTWHNATAKWVATQLAAVATSGAYSDLSGRPSLAAVATSGAYADLTGTPSLASVALSGAYADLTGKPTIPGNGSFNLASLGDTSITTGSGVDGYVVYWDNTAGKFKLKVVSGGSSTLASDTDVTITTPSNKDLLAYDTSSTKWKNASLSAILDGVLGSTQGSVLYRGSTGWATLGPGTTGQNLTTQGAGANPSWTTPSGGGGGGGGSVLSPPLISALGAVSHNPNSDTFTQRTSGAIPCLVMRPSGGDGNSEIFCELMANPQGSGQFSLVTKISLDPGDVSGGYHGAGLVIYNSANGTSYAYWTSCNGGASYSTFFATVASLGAGPSASASGNYQNDCFHHIDYDGTDIKFGLSKNGVDVNWNASIAISTFIGAVTHVGIGWGNFSSGCVLQWQHFFCGARGSSGIVVT